MFWNKNYTNTDYQLDYLFIAELANGSIYKQSPDDKARFTVGSSFSDIANQPLKKFSLVGKGHIFTIDLLDGHLEIDGRKLYPPTEVLAGAKLRLIYYRTVTRSVLIGPDGKPLPPTVKYVLGWQYDLGGKNYKWEVGAE